MVQYRVEVTPEVWDTALFRNDEQMVDVLSYCIDSEGYKGIPTITFTHGVFHSEICHVKGILQPHSVEESALPTIAKQMHIEVWIVGHVDMSRLVVDGVEVLGHIKVWVDIESMQTQVYLRYYEPDSEIERHVEGVLLAEQAQRGAG